MSRGPDATARLERALIEAGRTAGIDIAVVAADWTRWTSATFIGARHRIELSAGITPPVADWLAGLPEFEFELPGHLVADLIVNSVRHEPDRVAIEIEALTVEAR